MVGSGKLAVAEDGGSGNHCPNQRKAEFRQPAMPEKLLVSVHALFYIRDLPRFAFTGLSPASHSLATDH